MAEENSKMSLGKIVAFLIVLAVVFVVVNFLIGIAWTILKWLAIGAVALGVTWLFFRKSGSGSS